MDQDQLNNLRNIAQAAHNLEANRIARETAAATNALLRSQEQQRALEQQRLVAEQQRAAVEQQRLQEEQRRTKLAAQEQNRRIQLAESEANEKKALAERVKSVRVKMAAMEEEIGEFLSSLSKIDGNPLLTGGGPVATYQFLLLQRRLEKLVAQKSDLHELSDIRFIGQLEKSVRELRQAFPDFCGDPPVERALQYLKDLASWPSRPVRYDGRDITPSHLVQEVRKVSEGFLETFEKAKTEIASAAVIARLLSEITEQEQLLRDAEAAFSEEWKRVEPQIESLESIGVGLIEARSLVGTSVPHLVEQTDPIVRLQEGLRACRSGLDETEKCWARDNTAVQQARQYIADGRLLEAQNALESLHGKTWGDIDSQAVQKEFENAKARELTRLVAETDKVAVNAPFEAVRQLESRAPEYAQIQSVFSGLLQKRKEILNALETRLIAEITEIETKDRQRAIEHGDMLLKRAEGLPEIEYPLFEKVETLRGTVKRHGLLRKKKVAVGMQAVSVTFGVIAAVVTVMPELRLLEYVLNAALASALQECYVIPIFGGICLVSWIFLIARISGLDKQQDSNLADVRQAINRFQFDLENRAKQKESRLHTPTKKNISSEAVIGEGLSAQLFALGAVNPGDLFTNSFGHRFRWCPSGEFMMGSSAEEQAKAHECARRIAEDSGGKMKLWDVSNEGMHKVLLTRGRWLGEHPVTQLQWKAVMGESQLERIKLTRGLWEQWAKIWPAENLNVPICCISKTKASEYCSRLTEREIKQGLIPAGWSYQLPTEAEWEQACRAGTNTATYIGDVDYITPNNAPALDRIGWYWGNSFREFPDGGGLKFGQIDWSGVQYDGVCGPREVGLKEANKWGLKDTLGNVMEWCSNFFYDYDSRGLIDPVGPACSTSDVLRGGAYCYHSAQACRAAARYVDTTEEGEGESDITHGFRVALVPPRFETVRQHLLQILKQRTERHSDNV